MFLRKNNTKIQGKNKAYLEYTSKGLTYAENKKVKNDTSALERR